MAYRPTHPKVQTMSEWGNVVYIRLKQAIPHTWELNEGERKAAQNFAATRRFHGWPEDAVCEIKRSQPVASFTEEGVWEMGFGWLYETD